jgi:ankyrin repeat protein
MLELLLKYNKNLLNVINDNEDTPILFACKNKNIEIINTLASYKCDLSKVDKFENSIYHYISLYKLKTNIKSLNCKNKFNNTTLDYLLCNIWINVNK